MHTKMLTLAVIVAAAALTGLFATSPLAYAEDKDRDHDRDKDRDHDGDKDGAKGGDSSETNTDQELKQKNVGSGDAEQQNCAEQLIKAGAEDNCS